MRWWSGRTGIVARRTVAVGLALGATVALGTWLVAGHVRATVLDEGYLQGELQRLDAYAFVTDDVYAAYVDDFIDGVGEDLPEALGRVDVPSDEAARRELLRLARTAAPPKYLQQQTEALLAGLMPYLRGESDGFAIRPQLGARLEAVAGSVEGNPSALESAFRELGLGELMVEHLVARYATEQAGAPGVVAPSATSNAAATADASEWFTAELFAALDELVPYLLGETDSFAVEVSFEGREALAFPLADLLRTPPQALVARGYRFDERDLRAELAGAEEEALQDLDELRDALRPGWTLNERDVLTPDGDVEAAEELDALRRNISTLLGPARWAGLALAVVLFVAVGLLGGRRWSSRAAWASGAVLTGALALIVLPLAGYPLLGEPQIHEALLEATADWPEPALWLRERFIADIEGVLARLSRGLAWRTAPVAGLAALAFAASLGAMAYRRRSGPEGEMPSGADPASEERLAA